MTLELRCPTHPGYQAIRKPKVDCPDCWELYNMKHGNNNRVEEGQGAKVAELGGDNVAQPVPNPE